MTSNCGQFLLKKICVLMISILQISELARYLKTLGQRCLQQLLEYITLKYVPQKEYFSKYLTEEASMGWVQ